VRFLAVALGVFAFFVLGGFSLLRSAVVPLLVGTVIAREGQIEETVVAQAVIIRHERVLRSPVTGTVTLTLPEGSRARAEAVVANLSDTEERQQAEQRVAQLEADLEAYDEAHAEEEQALLAELERTRAEGLSLASRLRSACVAADPVQAGRTSLDLAAAWRREADASGRLEEIRKDRAAIVEALDTARLALAQSLFPVLAPEAGLVSYCLDGLEETLTPASVGRYATKDLLSPGRQGSATVDQARVEAGDPIAKVISDREAFVATVVKNSEADRLAQVREVSLRFPAFTGRREARATLFHVGQRERNGYCVVTYRTGELLDGMVSVRQVEVTVVVEVHSGTILPRRALVHRGGQDGVFVLDVSVCRFRPVTVLGGNDKEVVVEGLEPRTEVISTPWLVQEGQRIGDADRPSDVAQSMEARGDVWRAALKAGA